MRVFLFVPCFIDQLFPNVAASTLKVLKHLGCEVVYPTNQTCCGQPAYNSGYFEEARLMAMHQINEFFPNNTARNAVPSIPVEKKFEFDLKHDYVVGPSGSCVAMMRNFYPSLLESDARYTEIAARFAKRTFELTEFVSKVIGVEKFSGKLDALVSFHDSCHGLRELGLKKEPRQILSRIDGLKLVELPYNEVCCGFGGTFSVKFPEISVAMADEKLRNYDQTAADILVSTDTSCLMHLQGRARRNGSQKRFAHIAEIMAESIL